MLPCVVRRDSRGTVLGDVGLPMTSPNTGTRGLILLDGENVLVIRLCVSHHEGENTSDSIHISYRTTGVFLFTTSHGVAKRLGGIECAPSTIR